MSAPRPTFYALRIPRGHRPHRIFGPTHTTTELGQEIAASLEAEGYTLSVVEWGRSFRSSRDRADFLARHDSRYAAVGTAEEIALALADELEPLLDAGAAWAAVYARDRQRASKATA